MRIPENCAMPHSTEPGGGKDQRDVCEDARQRGPNALRNLSPDVLRSFFRVVAPLYAGFKQQNPFDCTVGRLRG